MRKTSIRRIKMPSDSSSSGKKEEVDVKKNNQLWVV